MKNLRQGAVAVGFKGTRLTGGKEKLLSQPFSRSCFDSPEERPIRPQLGIDGSPISFEELLERELRKEQSNAGGKKIDFVREPPSATTVPRIPEIISESNSPTLTVGEDDDADNVFNTTSPTLPYETTSELNISNESFHHHANNHTDLTDTTDASFSINDSFDSLAAEKFATRKIFELKQEEDDDELLEFQKIESQVLGEEGEILSMSRPEPGVYSSLDERGISRKSHDVMETVDEAIQFPLSNRSSVSSDLESQDGYDDIETGDGRDMCPSPSESSESDHQWWKRSVVAEHRDDEKIDVDIKDNTQDDGMMERSEVDTDQPQHRTLQRKNAPVNNTHITKPLSHQFAHPFSDSSDSEIDFQDPKAWSHEDSAPGFSATSGKWEGVTDRNLSLEPSVPINDESAFMSPQKFLHSFANNSHHDLNSTSTPRNHQRIADFSPELQNETEVPAWPTSKLLAGLFPGLRPKVPTKEEKKNVEVNKKPEAKAVFDGDEKVDGLYQEACVKIKNYEIEIEKLRTVNAQLKKSLSEDSSGSKQLAAEREAFERYRSEEADNFERFKEEEMAKFRKEKKLWEKHRKATEILPTKKERAEIESLKQDLAKTREQSKAKERKNIAERERLQRRVDELTKKCTELQQNICLLEQERLKAWGKQEQLGSAKEPAIAVHPGLQSKTAKGPVSKTSSISRSTGKQSYFPSSKSLGEVTSSKKTVPSKSAIPQRSRSQMTSRSCNKENSIAISTISDPGTRSLSRTEKKQVPVPTRRRYSEPVPIRDEEESEEESNDDETLRSGEESDASSSSVITVRPESHPETWWRDMFTRVEGEDKLSGKVHSYQEEILAGGNRERSYHDGTRIIIFRNATAKLIRNSGNSTVWFPNGDIKQTIPDQQIIYYYAATRITHTAYPDGSEVFAFPDGQTERRHLDGAREIVFADSTVKYVFPDGAEESVFPNGTVQKIDASGKTMTLEFDDGIKEVYCDEFRQQIFSDGSSKTVYTDGTQETRRADGSIRVKNKAGQVLRDTTVVMKQTHVNPRPGSAGMPTIPSYPHPHTRNTLPTTSTSSSKYWDGDTVGANHHHQFLNRSIGSVTPGPIPHQNSQSQSRSSPTQSLRSQSQPRITRDVQGKQDLVRPYAVPNLGIRSERNFGPVDEYGYSDHRRIPNTTTNHQIMPLSESTMSYGLNW